MVIKFKLKHRNSNVVKLSPSLQVSAINFSSFVEQHVETLDIFVITSTVKQRCQALAIFIVWTGTKIEKSL